MTLPNPASLLVYNPDLVPKKDLIAGFVARQPLLERLLEDIRREAPSGAPQHHLIIGQRGTGKTTLLRRLAYAVQDDADLAARWHPVTFPEEQYNVTDLASFWLNCVDALGDTLDAQGDTATLARLDQAVASMPADPAERRAAALKLLSDTSQGMGKRLLLLVDNVDLVFERIGRDVEWEFRRALQEQNRLLLIGASSRALEQAYQYDRAFYDFFSIHELGALTDDETLAVLKSLARQYSAAALSTLLEEHPGRIRAMRLLTGGNPRTIVLLYKVLAQRTEGDLETDLQELLDLYTPLYKARFEDLPQQAQVLVDAIAAHWDPITAGELAAQVGLPVNTVSAQLQRLEALGVTEKTPWFGEKKNAFQIAERFFNIWYLMRASRRVRRRLIWLVKFLEIWFNEEDLRARAQKHLSKEPYACDRASYAERSFAYAEAVGCGSLRTALEYAGLHACVDDAELRKQFDLSDLPPELQVKKERMELLQALHARVRSMDFAAAGIDPEGLWGLLGGSPHYTLNEKQRIVEGLGALEPAELRELYGKLARAKHRLLVAYRRDGTAVEKLYELLARGDMDDAYDWAAARACARSQEYRLLPLIGIQSRMGSHFRATPLETSELERAEATLQAMTQDNTYAASGWNGLGNFLRDQKRYEQAEAAYRAAMELDPQYADAWNGLGITFSEEKRYEEAETAYRKAIELDPQSANSWKGLGSILWHLRRYEEAEGVCREAIELDPQSAYSWNGLGNALRDQKRFAETEAAYRKAIDLDPRFPYAWNGLGNVLWDLKRYEEAEGPFRKAIDLNPQSAYPWNGLGNALLDQKRYEEAEAAYRKAIDFDRQYATPLRNLGLLLEHRLHRPTDAAEMYLEAVRRDPDWDPGLSKLRSICHKLASLADTQPTAERMARQGLDLLPGDSGLHAALAHALLARNAWDEARPLIESWATSATAWHEGSELFRAVVTAGRAADAAAVFEKVGANERLRPLYAALKAIEADTADYLRRFAPEVRVSASQILTDIAPHITETQTRAAARGRPGRRERR